jgi:hypothetical protein
VAIRSPLFRSLPFSTIKHYHPQEKTVTVIGLSTAVRCGLSGVCTLETVELKSARAIVELVLTPLVGLVGAVNGFYF